MNAGIFFQMAGGNQGIPNTGNVQKGDSGQNSNASFKKEMDKVFDRKQNSPSAAEKNTRTDRRENMSRIQQKSDLKKLSESSEEPVKEDRTAETSQEVQLLAAAQIQYPAAAMADMNACSILQQRQADTVNNVLFQSMLKEPDSNLPEALGNIQQSEDGEIKLPFQSNVDLAKSAMLKALQNESQEKPVQTHTEVLTKGQLQQDDGLQENNLQSKTTKLQSSEKIEEVLPDQTEGLKENAFAKNNSLDLSKVHIKVADAPVDTTQTDAAKQLADKIMYKLSEGRQEFDLELNPRELGKVNIKMIFENGKAQLIMSASNSKAHHLLSMQADALRGILEDNTGLDSTITLKQAETDSNQFDRDNFQEQSNSQQNQRQQQEKKDYTGDISFMDRLRLGLTEGLEEAV